MTDKELRRMSRGELLELLIAQMEENESLRTRLSAAEAQLEDRRIILDHAGSIAEAALSLNKVFEQAEAAAQQYLENVHRLANVQADAIVAQAREYNHRLHQETPHPLGGGMTSDDKASEETDLSSGA